MTPSFLALEHLAWCRARGIHPADVCASLGHRGLTWDDAVAAVIFEACCMAPAPEPERRLHLRPVERLRVVEGGR